ncbi:phosphopantetheine binding protein [Paenibacillus cellulosilyticus]|uniref:Phosphopantetheine binding protein n=1 Tax=Paenibacillus cellulosilyticus TaxID=375489 RepID=A0A2V2YUQ8_9BACL|nr:SDR family NAD(P)-dependent oxidoreductase [Paenibacillus cellulosilyticus]PWW04850.1 phosphopantetheine binding protein [Paenibacillus cellulosilyticus]QKS45963.1 SDR family NAD(P)-dependent oxidoreductase [Paenibacillus cellulosilyticus]
MAQRLLDIMKLSSENASRAETGKEIAVIGIGLDFPLASDANAYWTQASEGECATRELPYSRKIEADRYTRFKGMKRSDWSFIRQGYLNRIDRFDHRFFGMSPREAELTDPHQRLFMQTAWHTFEDAGYTFDKLKGSRTGVFIGYDHEAYNYTGRVLEVDPSSYKEAHVGNLVSMIPGRVSYYFDLKGPCMLVNTSCSSSLVAIHTAVRAIRSGECDAALAGGIRLDVLPIDLIGKVGIESAHGKTRTFDDKADGTVTGEGVCAVMLKPLRQALKDNDPIYAVVKGSATNQDGHSIGLTAPNALAQEEVLVSAWRDAEISPDTIGYLEAHGTGTKLGDPIEIDAVNKAFARFTERKQFCAISSAKPNIGHLIGAAGLAGFVRAVMAMNRKTLPPTLHFARPNRNISFIQSAVYVNDTAKPWLSDDQPRRCGVSSFGFSGTNCHIVLEEAPVCDMTGVAEGGGAMTTPLYALAISAHSVWSLRQKADRLAEWLSQSTERMEDICYTANVERSAFPYRLLVVGANAEELAARLSAVEDADYNQITLGAGLIVGTMLEGEGVLKDLAAAFVKGEHTDWSIVYPVHKHRQVRLPLYPFEPVRCWMDCPDSQPIPLWEMGWEVSVEEDGVMTGVSEHGSSIASTQASSQNSMHTANIVDGKLSRRTLILHSGDVRAVEIVNALQEAKHVGRSLIDDLSGEAGSQNHEIIELLHDNDSDYERLFEIHDPSRLERIVFIYTAASSGENCTLDEAQLRKGLDEGFFRLIELCKALTNKISRQPELVIVTTDAYSVMGTEVGLSPDSRLLHSLCETLPLESPNLRIRSIDIDSATSAERVAAEICCCSSKHDQSTAENSAGTNSLPNPAISRNSVKVSALRGGNKYARVCRIASVKNGPLFSGEPNDILRENELPLRAGGVYVISGGGGGIGQEIAKFIADVKPLHVAIITRTTPPDEHTLADIRSCGSTVSVHYADVACRDSLRDALASIRGDYGAIRGIVHCAGSLAAQGTLLRKERSVIMNQLEGKAIGALLLDELTNEDPLDFFLCSSSISAFVGIPGELDYSLGNSLLDALCEERSTRRSGTKCVNWPSWFETGMAVAYGADLNGGVLQSVSNGEAMEALVKVLRSELTQAIIGQPKRTAEQFSELVAGRLSMLDYYADHDQDAEAFKQPKAAAQKSAEASKSAIQLIGKGGSATETELLVGTAWSEVLGYAAFRMDDNFFDIGGNSIMILKIHAYIDKERPGIVQLPDLFAFPTIAKLAEYIDMQTQGHHQVGYAAATTEENASGEPKSADEEYEDIELLIEQLAKGELSVSGLMSTLNGSGAGEGNE